MRYKLPDHVTAISVGDVSFAVDEHGFITVPDDTPADIVSLLHDPHHHNLQPHVEPRPAEPVADDRDADDPPDAEADTTADKPARRGRKAD